MSTRQPVSLQIYDHDGAPLRTPIRDRARSVNTVIATFARGGTLLDRDGVDVHLAEDVPEGARPNISVPDKKVGRA
ncbi:hypothetical protein ACIGW8_20150 [Streptomyces sioyaensis]|uniref:hypothetical protein n=1 Tax=Streptomyces sioyaensis TaxID=67364 RepID=UPI0037D50523